MTAIGGKLHALSDRFYRLANQSDISGRIPKGSFGTVLGDAYRECASAVLALETELLNVPVAPPGAARRQPDEPLATQIEILRTQVAGLRESLRGDVAFLPSVVCNHAAALEGVIARLEVAPPGADLRAALLELITVWRTERNELNAAAAHNADLIAQAAWCGQALGRSDCAERLAALLDAHKEPK